MPTLKTVLISITFCLLTLRSDRHLSAQNTSPATHTSRLKFSVYPIGKGNWEAIYYHKQPGVDESLTFWSYERSPKHDYEGPLPIEFYRKEITSEGEPIYRTIGKAELKANSNEHLLFFIATGTASKQSDFEFQIIVMDESRQSFPLNTLTFVNATGANLEGVFGNQPILLKKGISAPYNLSKCYNGETFIGLAVQYEGTLRKVLQNKWSFYPNYREIILLLPPQKTDSMRIQAFRITQHKEEIVPPAVDANTGG